jgi:glycerol-3-phosphate acyltransferase PlsX
MGNDLGPHVIVEAACHAAATKSNLKQILIGDEETLTKSLNSIKKLPQYESLNLDERISLVFSTEVIGMKDKPAQALRKRHQSSMGMALSMVAKGAADACVSAGNTAALVMLSRALIPLLPGIDRPAISTVLPSIKGFTRMLDLGANIACDSAALFNFGIMGSIASKAIDGNQFPKIGLLNVGVEDSKGNDQVKQAAVYLKQESSINYYGFIEGNDIYSGKVDVVVCDGFVGNSVLKACEGITSFFGHLINNKLLSGMRGRIMQWLMRPALKRLRDEINPERYNGASFLGLEKVVVKSHGNANAEATVFAIEEAVQQVTHKVPEQIFNALEQLANNEE